MARTFTSHQARPTPRPEAPESTARKPGATKPESVKPAVRRSKEVGGPSGPEPTRYGDWERKGICVDF